MVKQSPNKWVYDTLPDFHRWLNDGHFDSDKQRWRAGHASARAQETVTCRENEPERDNVEFVSNVSVSPKNIDKIYMQRANTDFSSPR